jgi:hypothetical protein
MKIGTTLVLAALTCTLACESKKEEPLPQASAVAAPATPPPSPPPQMAATPPAADLQVARDAADLANKITRAPAEAEKLLTATGMTREQFMEKLYTIAEDPLLSAEYARLFEPAPAG